MSYGNSRAEDAPKTGWWVAARVVIWCVAAVVCAVVMIGTQSAAIRLVAMLLTAAVAATLHISFRPASAATKP